jgi:hypothetical protein
VHVTELFIGDHAYRLPIGTDENVVIDELADAVREGGGVVDLPIDAEQRAISVLISPGVPVFIERREIPEQPPDEDQGGDDSPSFVDWWI